MPSSAPSLRVALALALVSSVVPAARADEVSTSTPPAGTVTLPLAELLALKQASQAASGAAAPAPPVRASVTDVEIAGRLLDAGLDASAQVKVTVLGAGWVTVPVLELGPGTHLAGLPEVEGGVLTVIDRRLCLVTDTPGPYQFTVRFVERPEVDGRARRAAIRLPAASPAVLRLQHDETLFRLTSEAQREDGAGAVLQPAGGRIAVAWEQLAPADRRVRTVARPPVEPVVTSAHASVVATLEGRRITRVLYRLRFEGEKTFELTLPPGQAVERIFLNGAARPVARAGDVISLQVQAARAGDQSATVELVTSEVGAAYPLSGTLAFTLPRPAWEVNDLHATLHLPAVFEYRWAGGSLAVAPDAPAIAYAWEIPTPGRALTLHQQLVSSFATARVSYTVDLAGSYYR